jgi:RNA polymerase sigma-70 factor, ECF subfamily
LAEPSHFFGIATRLMREVLVDRTRAPTGLRSGAAATNRMTLDEGMALSPQREVKLLALDDALTKLESIDPRKSRIVELRFFSGLSIQETAEVMKISPRTVIRQ